MRKITLIIFVFLLFVPILAFAQGDSGALVLTTASASDSQMDSLLKADAGGWSSYTANSVKFNPTPPVHYGDATFDGFLPTVTAQLARSGNRVMVKLTWNDASENVTGKGRRYSDVGEDHIYFQQTESTSSFADAACLMIPQSRQPLTSYPSLMMGQGDKPVDIYLWRAGEGFSALSGKGRATLARIEGVDVVGNASRTDDSWSVVVAVNDLPVGTPVSFAIWDGERTQRDGLKYYSLWYEVE